MSEKVQRGSLPNSHSARPERPYRRYESSPVAESVVSAAARTGAVTALRAAAELSDAKHAAEIESGGITYVQTWLTAMADDLEKRSYEKDSDGVYDYGGRE